MLKGISPLKVLLIASLLLLGISQEPSAQEAYPGHKFPSCLSVLHTNDNSDAAKRGEDKARAALIKEYDSPESVWDQEVLQTKPLLAQALKEFKGGTRGQSVKALAVANKTVEALHVELIAHGFKHERVPLSAPSEHKEKLYWRRDGTKTGNPSDPDLIPFDLYAHADGGIVRVKPEGIPNPKNPMPQPHMSKAVLLDLRSKLNRITRQKEPRITYSNEAFKVTDEGIPVPKSPAHTAGLRRLYDREELEKSPHKKELRAEQRAWINTIVEAGHIDLKADFSHCRNVSTGS